MVRAFGPETFGWPKVADVVGVVGGVSVALLVLWVLLKLFKAKTFHAGLFIIILGFWMLCFGLLTSAQLSSKTKWEYLLYAVLILFGWLCSCNSIKEHFCEKIFMSRKEVENC